MSRLLAFFVCVAVLLPLVLSTPASGRRGGCPDRRGKSTAVL